MTDATVTYLFDPLCGWCYGATPMLDRLAASGITLTLMPKRTMVAVMLANRSYFIFLANLSRNFCTLGATMYAQ